MSKNITEKCNSYDARLLSNPMLKGVTKEEWKQMELEGHLRQVSCKKNERIFRMGEKIHEIGMIVEGHAYIQTSDLLGNQSILSDVKEGEVFGETYAFCEEPMMVEVVASQNTALIFLDVDQLQNANTSWQEKIMRNMLQISLRKNLLLSQRIFCTTPKTVRERVLTFLTSQSIKQNKKIFEISFNRQQMADYLNLDRSALSKELGRMKKEGIIDFHKNTFRLMQV